MAFRMQDLLKLPPSLRCQVFTNVSRWAQGLDVPAQRRNVLFRRSYAQARPKPTVRQPTPGGTSPTAPPPRSASRPMTPYAERLCQGADQVLLYNSPNHNGFQLASYICGTFFFVSAFSAVLQTKGPVVTKNTPPEQAEAIAKMPPPPAFTRYVVISGAFGVTIMGTVLFLAPTKMIRRIWLLKPTRALPAPTLNIEVKSIVPFWKGGPGGRTITTPLPDVTIDRRPADVKAASGYSIPLTSSAAFTNHYLPADHPLHARGEAAPATFGSRLQDFNAGLLNAWPNLKRNANRMFMRDGMAYMHMLGEDGQWKLDLHGAEMLDGGRPLEELLRVDPSMAKGVIPWFQRWLGRAGQAAAGSGR